MANAHHPTLLAATAQTVCSQRYTHLLVLFQEIITLYVICACACVCERDRACAEFLVKLANYTVAIRWQTHNIKERHKPNTEVGLVLSAATGQRFPRASATCYMMEKKKKKKAGICRTALGLLITQPSTLIQQQTLAGLKRFSRL